jgi:tRNA1Val (adenine37-N6)-methyltransferase
MGIFRFKQFSVNDDVSAMKVGTDAVMLGGVMTLSSEDRTLLDIGTGSGIISLMVAQRLSVMKSDVQSFFIDAIDVDSGAAVEAAENFSASKWGDSLRSIHSSLEDYSELLRGRDFGLVCKGVSGFVSGNHLGDVSSDVFDFASKESVSVLGAQRKYDVIFSNPPYFDFSLQSPDARRAAARNSDVGLSYREIIDFAVEFLSDRGRLSLVLPSSVEGDLIGYALSRGLSPFRIVRAKSVARKSPVRIIAEFSFAHNDSPEELLLTINDGGGYTSEYTEFVRDFYLNL